MLGKQRLRNCVSGSPSRSISAQPCLLTLSNISHSDISDAQIVRLCILVLLQYLLFWQVGVTMSFIHISQPCPALPEYLFPGFLTHGAVIRLLVIRPHQSDARHSLPPGSLTITVQCWLRTLALIPSWLRTTLATTAYTCPDIRYIYIARKVSGFQSHKNLVLFIIGKRTTASRLSVSPMTTSGRRTT